MKIDARLLRSSQVPHPLQLPVIVTGNNASALLSLVKSYLMNLDACLGGTCAGASGRTSSSSPQPQLLAKKRPCVARWVSVRVVRLRPGGVAVVCSPKMDRPRSFLQKPTHGLQHSCSSDTAPISQASDSISSVSTCGGQR